MDYTFNGMPDPMGIRTDQAAKLYAKERGVTYSNALKIVMQREQRQYEADVVSGESNQPILPPGISQAFTVISNVAASQDAAEAARKIKSLFDRNTIALAAQYVIEKAAARIIDNLSGGRITANLQSAYRQVQSELPATWSIYACGASMSEAAVQEMSHEQIFRTRY
jgi:hypothetical protein